MIFDVNSNGERRELLTQWLNMVPVTFDTYPLVTPEQALQFLKSTAHRETRIRLHVPSVSVGFR